MPFFCGLSGAIFAGVHFKCFIKEINRILNARLIIHFKAMVDLFPIAAMKDSKDKEQSEKALSAAQAMTGGKFRLS